MSNTVPEDWEIKTIAEIGNVVTGSTPSTKEPSYWGGKIPFISPADFEGKVYVDETERTLTETGSQKSRLLPKDSILVTCIGSLGGMAMSSRESVTNQQINAVIADESQHSRFHFYNILFNIHELIKSAGTTTIPIINKSTFSQINLLTPPLLEQEKIAAILSSVDDVIEKTRVQIDKLKDLKTGMMQELLTKGIGSDGVPHTEFKDSPVGRIPRAWGYELLESVATVQTGIAKNAKAQGDMIEVPYLRVANVQDGYLDLSEIKSIRIDRSRLERFSLKDEDVLVNEGGDFDKLGRGAIWDNRISPCVHQNHVFVVRTDKSYLLPKFFNYLSGSQYGKKYYLGCAKQTTNLASLNSSQLKAFPVLLPPVGEQAAICDLLDSVDKKITLSERKKSAAETLKRALMQDLLTGNVRVNVSDNESAVA